MAISRFGRRLSVSGVDSGATVTIYRSLTGGASFTTQVAIYSRTNIGAGVLYYYEDVLPNDGVTRYWRAKESQSPKADSVYSGTISGAPENLDI